MGSHMEQSSIAYSYHADIGSMSWGGNLIDIQQFSNGGLDLYVLVAYTELDEKRNRTVIIAITVAIGTTLIVICAYILWRTISNHHGNIYHHYAFKFTQTSSLYNSRVYANLQRHAQNLHNNKFFLFTMREIIKGFIQLNGGGAPVEYTSDNVFGDLSQVKLQELLIFNFEKIVTATNNFHHSNKLGQGGFGPVYKGQLQDGQEIAVQGLEEFMSEVVVISKLQHLIILLDVQLNPKISEFCMARIFGGNEDQANTRRIVGTYGYMSPEYAMQGLLSEKSDVFSFGFLLR
ncbi:G-type lectin S-receptor-like serine/threonine-protein kinase [Glycine soja]|uniref:G-type lectin S-receptor-like serine/threonine-protein kinase n=1 Tax=Glycine soja TaxID=3848 RepID=A0A0B2QYV0_GLYSO|nr:G-type lectin S-receptor-like serine/threonine-protein kinase [Glycine soja]